MANSYSQFSEIIDGITPEMAAWIETVLRLDVEDDDELEKLLTELGVSADQFETQCWPDFSWTVEGANKSSLWLYCEESYTEDHLVLFLQAFFRKFMPDYVFSMTGAATCSKPRVGEFGGWWLVVTKDSLQGGDTWDATRVACKALEPMSDEVRSQVSRIETEIDFILTDTNVEPKVLAEALRRLAASAEERDA